MKKSLSTKYQSLSPQVKAKKMSTVSMQQSSMSIMSLSQSTVVSSRNNPTLKLSFYHRNYLLPFKLCISIKPIVSSSINYKQLEAKFYKILSEELIFATSQKKALVQKINLNYLEQFINLIEEEKKLRFQKDFMGSSPKDHILSLGKKWTVNSQMSENSENFMQTLFNTLQSQEIQYTKVISTCQKFLYSIEPLSNWNLKDILPLIKFIQLTFLDNQKRIIVHQDERNQVYLMFGLLIILLKIKYQVFTSLDRFFGNIHQNFVILYALSDSILRITEDLIKNIDSNSVKLLEMSLNMNKNMIKMDIFIWSNIHKLNFSNEKVTRSQQILDGERNFPIYKASSLIKTIQMIQLIIKGDKMIKELEHQETSSNSLFMWLLDEQANDEQNNDNFFKNCRKDKFFEDVKNIYKSYQGQSILEHLIDEVSYQKRKQQQRQILRRKSQQKTCLIFQNFNIQNNLNYTSSLCILAKQILQNYIQPTGPQSETQSKGTSNSTSQLLLFVTEIIKFQLPEHVKKIEQSIKERKYKPNESVIVGNIMKNFNGIVASGINENLLSELRTIDHHFFYGQQIQPKDNIPYFRIKELIHYIKPTEDGFFKLCKNLLKDLKFLSKEFSSFKSGKIVVERKSLVNEVGLDEKWKQDFIKKRKKKVTSGEDGQNFYQVYYFDYDKMKGQKHLVEVGINVNLIDEEYLKSKQLHTPKVTVQQTNEVKVQSSLKKITQQQQSQKPTFSQLPLPQQHKKIRKLSQQIQESHQTHNKNNQILKQKDQKVLKLYKQNQQLIKVNTWYEEQLRIHEDKQSKLEGIIAQLISFNKVKEQKLDKKRKILAISHEVFSEKIQHGKGFQKKIHPANTDDNLFRNSFNRLSRDSGTNRPREKSIAHIRLIHDLNKLSSPPAEKGPSQFILPPPPPPPISSLPNTVILPPPPSLPLPPSLSNLSIIPPPPPPPPPILPPPLLLSAPDITKKQQQSSQPKRQMKTFGWTMIDVTTIPSSFWQNVEQVQFDQQDVIIQFSKTPQNIVPKIVATKEKQLEKKSILKPDRVKNIQICLRKTRLKYENMNNLEEILYKYDENYFDQDIIQCLRSLLPTQKEKQQFSQIKIKEEDKFQWTLADYFIYRLLNIESYEERLNAIHFKNQFESINKELMRKINIFIDFFKEVKNDEFLQTFLTYLLSIGNFLNSKSHKSGAYGFRFQSIPKSYTLIGQDHQTSLFDYVLKLIFTKTEQLFTKYLSYTYFDAQSTKLLVALNIIEDDFKMITKQCQNIQQIIIYSKRQDDNSSNYLLLFYIKVQQQINVLKKVINEAKIVFQEVSDFYCEKMTAEQFIGSIVEFRKRVMEFAKVNMKKKTSQAARMSWAMSQRFSNYSMYS